MTYVFRNVTVRTKGEINSLCKYVSDKDFFDRTAEDYYADEVVTVCEGIKVYPNGLELTIDDGNDKVVDNDMNHIPRYIVELWKQNGDVFLVDTENEVYDPESYSEHCTSDGDEIRIYDSFEKVLVDYYEYSIEKEQCYDRD